MRLFPPVLRVLLVLVLLGILFQGREAYSETVRPLHKSEPNMQTHEYLVGEAAWIWPGTSGQEPLSQSDWTQFFAGPHDELWDHIGARTEYFNSPPNPVTEDGTVTYGGRHGGAPVQTILWTPTDEFHDVPYSEFSTASFYTHSPLVDLLENDDATQLPDGNLTTGSWPNVGDDIVEGAHEEDLFFVHSVFDVLYDIYGDPEFNPVNDYLQDEFYKGLDLDSAEVFYHHLWRRIDHNDSDISMMGVSWYTSQSSWEEVIIMPDVFSLHPSPIQISEAYWQMALDFYSGENGRPKDRGLAYYFLGRIAHLLVDLTVPAHAHCDPHSPIWPDSYENYMGDTARYSQYAHDEIPTFDSGGVVTGATQWTYAIGDWPYTDFDYVRNQIPGTKWDFAESNEQAANNKWETQSNLFRLFWCTAEIADNFDSDSANGEIDGGTRSAGGFSEFELRSVADTLMPQAMISLAELYKLFRDAAEAVELSRINLSAPANESILYSAPAFAWTTDGGTDNAFIVDLSFSVYGPFYPSPIIRGDSGWNMPGGIWNMIPSGSYVYWRMRGADLDVWPLSIIYSSELWWFYKP